MTTPRNRRDFLKTVVAAGGATALAAPAVARAGPENTLSPNRRGVLVDTTVCVGCRNCEWACKTAHNLETGPLETYKDRSVFAEMRRPDDTALTIVNEYPNPSNPALPIDVKFQCMHCDRPACLSACIVGAFKKNETGAVVWDGDMCIGCRYCMVACPFQVPAFEYQKAIHPEIRKCDFCHERQAKGELPACVDICPVEALTFGPREELVQVARRRIRRSPERYINHVYGEHEVGGTSWLYLAGKEFTSIGLPKVGTAPAPGTSEAIQHGIFAYFVPPVALYALLGSIMWLSKDKPAEGE
jgi:Fe-S-cluster-containing dehydrogenase component